MITIREIKREYFHSDVPNMEIATSFMFYELKMNSCEIDKHHPLHVTSATEKTLMRTLSLWSLSHQERPETLSSRGLGTSQIRTF